MRKAVFVAMLLATTLHVRAATDFPKPSGHVNDFANLLTANTRADLESLLTTLEAETTAEVAVATVTSLDGMSVEEYANRMFQEWGVGQKATDNGVLVVVAPSDRAMRIEVGYGLEGILPDGLAGSIVREDFLPHFRADDYQTGIVQGVRHLADIVRRNETVSDAEGERLAESESSEPPLWVMTPFLGLFVAMGLFGVGVGLRAKAFFPILWGSLFGGMPLVMSLVFSRTAFLILAPIGASMLAWGFAKGRSPYWRNTLRGWQASDSTGWVAGTSSSSDSGSSSGGSSGSFGGGSSGGGGASGRW